ncbi:MULTISPECIES: carbamoyltransferase HypF [unclassified Thioalkalivibrio]|uniref:carbamoyltransferase HypF n=1 Tax=unclassified Thioalkalivibrio TaxID=2621013 RepID=UPI000368633B|nr:MULTISPECIES: carbamoyltransferase HypF [unclassified Thioalkalivibrio]
MNTPATLSPARERWRLVVTGRVQGVGFRPFVAALARRLSLAGTVGNTPAGVVIEAEGDAASLDAFRAALAQEAPAAAHVDGISVGPVSPTGAAGFRVTAGPNRGGAPALAADRAPCPDCLAEIRDPTARRYRYPFTACTACGPRWSIATALPWDRAGTTLHDFPLCPACRAEFENPGDRRFHAEAMACPDCGPRLVQRAPDGTEQATGDAALDAAVATLREGQILALKGPGGFQLLTDATRESAVARLRARKQRPEKPLAVLLPDGGWLDRLAHVSEAERALLDSPEAPIVLVDRKIGAPLAGNIAPGLNRLGLMRAATPLHQMLLDALAIPLVCTSGNRSGEPLCIDGEEAVARLGVIADAILDHDRPIARPLDDSVFQIAAGQPQCLRLGRGTMPLRIPLPAPGPVTLALGGHLKAAPALALNREVVVGAHVGDLDSDPALRRLDSEARALAGLCGVQIEHVACDRHPDYASTALAEGAGVPVFPVQHHHAHAAACLAEQGVQASALALVWDGAGLGTDGTLWGGECLTVAANGDWQRLGHLRPFRLPGGEAAIREPRRALLGLLHAHFASDTAALAASPARALFDDAEWPALLRVLDRGVNAPWTSSVGRLFDAVAALTGLRTGAGFEGQAAMLVQQAAEAAPGVVDAPDLELENAMPWQADWGPLIAALLAAQAGGAAPGAIAARLHIALARFAVAAARASKRETVALTGGCFQNRHLLQCCVAALRDAGFHPLWPRAVPPNDGGLALGQAVLARRAAHPARPEEGD